jgi:CheY-like chemotaxis protein
METHARILVVEDDPSIREALAELLTEEGYAVASAANGAEALALLELEAPPSLILLDLMMPVMDGWAFRSAQRRDPRLSRIPVLVLSASRVGDGGPEAELAADAFLQKPFDLEALVGFVRWLTRSTPPATPPGPRACCAGSVASRARFAAAAGAEAPLT